MEKEIRFYYDLNKYEELVKNLKSNNHLEYKGCYFERTTQYDNPNSEYSFYSKEVDGRFRFRTSKCIDKNEYKAMISWKRRLNKVNDGIHTEEEVEVSVPQTQIEQMEFLLENVIKMKKVECYERYRNVFDGGNVEIVLDKFPFIVALEIESKDGSDAPIKEWLKILSLDVVDAYSLSWDDKYRELCAEERNRTEEICTFLIQ